MKSPDRIEPAAAAAGRGAWAAAGLAVLLCAAAPQAQASPELAKQNGCLGCHDVAKRVLGPAFVDVAKRHGSAPDAAALLAKSIRQGSTGAWGAFPMPPQPVSSDDAAILARWILAAGTKP